jgi:hypothetical protein
MSLSRVRIDDNMEIGLAAYVGGTQVEASDVLVRDTRPAEADGTLGRGLSVELGASVELTRGRLERNHDVAAFAQDPGTALTLLDVRVRDTRSQAADGLAGRGVAVQAGASLRLERGVVESSRDVGVLALEVESADLRNLSVSGVAASESCDGLACGDLGGGVGLGAFGGPVQASRFTIAGAMTCGVLVATDSDLDLSTGRVGDSRIGACVQAEGYRIERLTDGVAYVDNERNLDATSFPIPEPRTGSSPAASAF